MGGGGGGAYLQIGEGGGRTSGFKLRLHIARLLFIAWLCLHFLLYVVLQGPGWDILVRVRDCTGHRLTVEGERV